MLVMDAQDGDRKAMEQLVGRWQKRLWQHAYRMTCDQQGAWDITQQTWYDIIRKLRKLHDPAKFKAWAYKITTCKSIDWIKKKNKSRQRQIDTFDIFPAVSQDEIGLKELMNKLTIAKKAVLSLYYFEQLSIPEISMVMKIPTGTVKSRLHNARSELKELWLNMEK